MGEFSNYLYEALRDEINPSTSDGDYTISLHRKSVKVPEEVFFDNYELENILRKKFPGAVRGSGNEIGRNLKDGTLEVFPFMGAGGTTFKVTRN